MKTNKTLYFLLNQKCDQRNIKRFYFNKLQEHNFKVTVINFYNQKKVKKNKFNYICAKKNYFKLIIKAIFEKPHLYVALSNKDFKEIFFQFILSSLGCKKVTLDVGLLPTENVKFHLIKTQIANKKYFSLIFIILIRIIYKIFLKVFLPKSDISFAAGKIGNYLAKKRGDKKIIKSHNLDYDNFLLTKSYKKKSNYAVYVDQDYINSDDLKHDYIKFEDYKNFEKKVKNFLENLKLDIKVAGSTRRLKKKNLFNYSTKYFETEHLIKNSKIVIGHNSTALQYAILFSKPVILLSTPELKKIEQIHQHILILKKHLKCNYFFLNDNFNNKFKINYKINLRSYKKFIKYYIKENTESRSNVLEIFKKEINLYY